MDINTLILGIAIGFSLVVVLFSLVAITSDRKVRSGSPKNPPPAPPPRPPNYKSSVMPPKHPTTRSVEGCLKCEEMKGAKLMEKKNWKEFRDSGLFWWINMILHTFGWAIVVEVEGGESGEVIAAYPARTTFRGFPEKYNTEGYQKVTEFMHKNSSELLEETKR